MKKEHVDKFYNKTWMDEIGMILFHRADILREAFPGLSR